MQLTSPHQFYDLLDKALSESIGIAVPTDDTRGLYNKLIKIRLDARSAGITTYDSLTFKMTKDELWIFKGKPSRPNGSNSESSK